MTWVLDASLVVAALRKSEPAHAQALKCCTPFFSGQRTFVVPGIFDAEVTSALVRRGVKASRVQRFFRHYLRTRRLITLGPRAVKATQAVIATTKLRAADAFYVWVAAREGLPLLTLDEDVLRRAPLAGVVATMP